MFPFLLILKKSSNRTLIKAKHYFQSDYFIESYQTFSFFMQDHDNDEKQDVFVFLCSQNKILEKKEPMIFQN